MVQKLYQNTNLIKAGIIQQLHSLEQLAQLKSRKLLIDYLIKKLRHSKQLRNIKELLTRLKQKGGMFSLIFQRDYFRRYDNHFNPLVHTKPWIHTTSKIKV